MIRDARYIVLKMTDVHAAGIIGQEAAVFNAVCDKVFWSRRERGKNDLGCVVVETDWPEYEPTWAAIDARMEGKEPPISDREKALVKAVRSVLKGSTPNWPTTLREALAAYGKDD